MKKILAAGMILFGMTAVMAGPHHHDHGSSGVRLATDIVNLVGAGVRTLGAVVTPAPAPVIVTPAPAVVVPPPAPVVVAPPPPPPVVVAPAPYVVAPPPPPPYYRPAPPPPPRHHRPAPPPRHHHRPAPHHGGRR